ncbi:hypothetical protein AB0P16_11890 [Dietzia maris]|uniref:hypothetical protein n=1 Tax=Dietzia maris TaxID=37915 RepID=UPI00343FB915
MSLPVLEQPGDHAFWHAEIATPTPTSLRNEWARRTAERGRDERLYRNQLTEWSKPLVTRGWVHTEFPGMEGVIEDSFRPAVDAAVAAYASVISHYAYPFSVYCLWFRTLVSDRRPPVRGWGQQFKECERNGVPVAVREFLWMSGEGRPLVLKDKPSADRVVESLFRGAEPHVHDACTRVALLTYAWALEEFGRKVVEALPDLEDLALDGDTKSAALVEKSRKVVVPLFNTISEIRDECQMVVKSREAAVEWANDLVDGIPAITEQLENAEPSGAPDQARVSTVEALARLLSTGQMPDPDGVSKMFFGRLYGLRRRAEAPRREQVVSVDLIRARLKRYREVHIGRAGIGDADAHYSLYVHSAEWDIAVDLAGDRLDRETKGDGLAALIDARIARLDERARSRLVGENRADSVEMVIEILHAAAKDAL